MLLQCTVTRQFREAPYGSFFGLAKGETHGGFISPDTFTAAFSGVRKALNRDCRGKRVGRFVVHGLL